MSPPRERCQVSIVPMTTGIRRCDRWLSPRASARSLEMNEIHHIGNAAAYLVASDEQAGTTHRFVPSDHRTGFRHSEKCSSWRLICRSGTRRAGGSAISETSVIQPSPRRTDEILHPCRGRDKHFEAMEDRGWRDGPEAGTLGAAWTDSGLVFTREDGTPVHPDRFSKLSDNRLAQLVYRASGRTTCGTPTPRSCRKPAFTPRSSRAPGARQSMPRRHQTRETPTAAGVSVGTPGGIRTPNLLIRSQTLCPD